jgi:hypothetical protein
MIGGVGRCMGADLGRTASTYTPPPPWSIRIIELAVKYGIDL